VALKHQLKEQEKQQKVQEERELDAKIQRQRDGASYVLIGHVS
jgi:hypothetical protein